METIHRFGDDGGIVPVVLQVLLDLPLAGLGEDGLCTALGDVAHAVELRGLAAKPHLVEARALALQGVRYDGVAATGTGEAGLLREAAELDRDVTCARDLVDAVRQVAGHEALIGGIEKEDRVVLLCEAYPLREALAVIDGAGRIVRAAEVNDVGPVLWCRERQEAVLFGRHRVDDLPAGHHVGVDVDRIDRIGNEHGVVLIEEIQDVAEIGLCAVRDEDLVEGELYAELLIIRLDRGLQEIVALLRTVAMEALGPAHILRRLHHRINDGLRQRAGDITDAHADQLIAELRMRRLPLADTTCDLRKKIALI